MLEFSERKTFTEDFVLVDGVTRTGKFALSHVVASFDRVEFFQYPPLLETLLYLHRLGKIETDACKALLRMDFDMNTFNMMIGRSVNTRVQDLSCIYRSANFEDIVARASTADRESLEARFYREKHLPFFINHEGMSNLKTLFAVFPRVKMINIVRDPCAVIESWFKRGWGNRIGSDPKDGWITFKHPKGPVPWWAVDWAEEYHDLPELDRCAKNVAVLSAMAKEQHEAAPEAVRREILMAQFERLIIDPMFIVGELEKFLGRKPLPTLSGILGRERLPRKLEGDPLKATQERVLGAVTKKTAPIVEKLIHDYDRFWVPLAEKGALNG